MATRPTARILAAMAAPHLIASFGILVLAAALPAQEFVSEDIPDLGVKVKIHKKLKPVPLEGGADKNVIQLHQRAKFEPKSRQQFIVKAGQPFNWGLDVYAFEEAPKYNDKPKNQDEVRRRAVEKRRFDQMAFSFEHFATTKDPRSAARAFHGKGGKAGLKVKAKGKTPAHKLWEFSNEDEIEESRLKFRWYTIAASYKLGKREIALAFMWPVFKDKPDAKYLKIGKKLVQSLIVDESAMAVEADAERDKFADTDARKQVVADAVKGIIGLDGWNYFTTPECVTIYSWKPGSPKEKKARAQAEKIAAHLGSLQELYKQTFPAYEELTDSYPVVRICFDRHTFRLYGSPPVGAEGFYDGGDIVVMDGGDQTLEQLVARYGFMQFARNYFRGAKLAPWFAEGFGDWFAAHKRAGKNWKFAPLKHRLTGPDSVRTLFKKSEAASLTEFLRWPAEKFAETEDNDDAKKCLGQAYALADVLMRGASKLGAKWDPGWNDIVPTFTATLKKTRNSNKAEKAAFGAVDEQAFQDAWSAWVATQINKK